jgi:hypothetical protein
MRPPRLLSVAGLVLALLTAWSPASAAAKKRYLLLIDQVTVKGIPADKTADVLEPTKAQLARALAANPQLVASLEGAPDPAEAKKFHAWLTKKKLSGAYRVSVEINGFEEEVEDKDASRNQEKRLNVRLSLRMFSETMPERKMGFSGDGSATVKLDIGKKLRPKDRTHAIQQAIEIAIDDALATSLKQLAVPPTAPKK